MDRDAHMIIITLMDQGAYIAINTEIYGGVHITYFIGIDMFFYITNIVSKDSVYQVLHACTEASV
jgi:hypothetical protein